MGVPQTPLPSTVEHYIKLALSIIGLVAGAVLAVLAPAYVIPVAGVIAALSGLFGATELVQHVKSYKP